MVQKCMAKPERKAASRESVRMRHSGGFSLVELIIVMVVMLCVTALALPNLTTMVASAKLRGGMGDLSGLFQNARSLAVKQNQMMFVHFETSGSNLVAYVDKGLNPNGAPATGLPQLRLPTQFTEASEPSGGSGTPTALDVATCGGTSGSPCSATDGSCDPYFTPMGTPCNYVSAGNCTSGTTFVHYFNYAGMLGSTQWSAVCISPAGRIKSWYWSGSSWTN